MFVLYFTFSVEVFYLVGGHVEFSEDFGVRLIRQLTFIAEFPYESLVDDSDEIVNGEAFICHELQPFSECLYDTCRF